MWKKKTKTSYTVERKEYILWNKKKLKHHIFKNGVVI